MPSSSSHHLDQLPAELLAQLLAAKTPIERNNLYQAQNLSLAYLKALKQEVDKYLSADSKMAMKLADLAYDLANY